MISPNKASRELDSVSGYKLGINLGEVLRLEDRDGEPVAIVRSGWHWSTLIVFPGTLVAHEGM